MPTVLMVIAQQVFRDEEYAEPKRVLEEHGATVVTASVAPGEAVGRFGLRAHADIALADALAPEKHWDAVIFVGGAGASVFFDDASAHELATRLFDAGAVVSAICIAPSTLARAGLLRGVPATAFASQQDDLRAHGALWTGDPVTVSGRLITANGPEAAHEFGEAVAEALGI